MDESRLLQCLPASLHSDASVRSAAEAQLSDASKKPGFGVVLAKVTLAQEVAPGVRQLAAVLLKQHVKTHWHEGGEKFEPPVVPDTEKQAIRDALLRCLSDPVPAIRTAVGMAVASIAMWDCPENWPNVLEFLVRAIKERKDPHLGMQIMGRSTGGIGKWTVLLSFSSERYGSNGTARFVAIDLTTRLRHSHRSLLHCGIGMR